MAEEKKITAEVVRYVKSLAQGDITAVFQDNNPFKNPDGTPLALEAEILDGIALGEYDHLLQESSATSETPTTGMPSKGTSTMGTGPMKTPVTEDVNGGERKEKSKQKKTKKGKSEKLTFESLKKRVTIALCILIPLLILAIVFQEEIMETLTKVAKSFAMVSGIVGLGFMVPMVLRPDLKKGLRVGTFVCSAVGFYVITLSGGMMSGFLALAVAVLLFTLAF